MRIATIGAGYVGLVSGACLADFGHVVTCVDIDPDRVAALSAGQIPIFEPGLDTIVAENIAAARLSFTTDIATAVADADVVIIAVGTPSRDGDGAADLGFVYAAARAIAPELKGFTVVVMKSTVPVGTGDEVERIIREAAPEADFDVVSNPEFLREGAAIKDFKIPDRIVVGVESERASAVMAEVYRPLFLNQSPLLVVSRRTAEVTKYAANSFLAMKITFINEMSDLCEAVGANVQDVARGLGLDKRIGPKFLNAGPGYGGSCLPKDTRALARTAANAGAPMRLVETTIAINDARKRIMAQKVIAALDGSVRGKNVAVLGLTFKPNTDDMREAPSLEIIGALQAEGAVIRAFDPHGMASAKTMLKDVSYGTDAYDTARGADVLVIVTEWEAFRALDFARLKQVMRQPVLVDLRNIYREKELQRQGFAYYSVGRPRPATTSVN